MRHIPYAFTRSILDPCELFHLEEHDILLFLREHDDILALFHFDEPLHQHTLDALLQGLQGLSYEECVEFEFPHPGTTLALLRRSKEATFSQHRIDLYTTQRTVESLLVQYTHSPYSEETCSLLEWMKEYCQALLDTMKNTKETPHADNAQENERNIYST